MIYRIFNLRKIGELRQKAMYLDKINNVDCEDYNNDLFILKSCIVEVTQYIQRDLPFAEVRIEDYDNKNIASAIYKDNKYTIIFNRHVLNIFKNHLKNIFIDDTNIYNEDSFKIYENEKKELCDLIYEYGLMYCLLHEYTHVKEGHLKFLNDYPDYKKDYETIRTLEFRADNGAASMMTGIAVVELFSDFENLEKNISLFTLSAYILINLFTRDNYTWDIQDVEIFEQCKDNHPPYGYRQYILLDSMLTKLYELLNEEKVNKIGNSVIKMIYDFEKYRQGNENLNLKQIPLTILYTPEGHESLKQIHTHWSNIQNLVIPYSHSYQPFYIPWVDTPEHIMNYFKEKFESNIE